jgi:SAM-dependent methyltransferase
MPAGRAVSTTVDIPRRERPPRIFESKGIHMVTSSIFLSADGDGYNAQMGRWSRRLAPQFIDFASIADAKRVLDVGCGTGSLTFALAGNKKIEAISGLDFSSAYVEHATRHNRDSRIDFRVGDACALPFPDDHFDHALTMLVLQFVPQADLAVRELCRVVAPGGTVAAATWDTRGGLVYYRMFFDAAAILDPHADERRKRAYSRPLTRPGDLSRAWTDAGLQDVFEDTRTIRMDFSSFDDFWTPNAGKDGPVADYIGTLDTAAKAKLRATVERAYLDGDPDGPRSYAATARVVKGTVPARD